MPSTEMRNRLRNLLPDGTHLTQVWLTPSDSAPGEPPISAGWLQATVTRDGIPGESTIELMLRPPGGGYAVIDSPSDSNPGSTPSTTGPTSGATATPIVSGPSDTDRISCPGNLLEFTSCTEVYDHGVHVGRTSDFVSGELTQHEATITAETGLVYVAIANTTDDKWGPGSPTSAAAPALTSDDLLTIATASTWTDWTPPAS
jgi:hypothetical protein